MKHDVSRQLKVSATITNSTAFVVVKITTKANGGDNSNDSKRRKLLYYYENLLMTLCAQFLAQSFKHSSRRRSWTNKQTILNMKLPSQFILRGGKSREIRLK